jgi:hypothetical protein
MANAYTIFWARDRAKTLRRLGWEGRQIETLFGGPHTSEPSFIRAGVRAGDWVYPITVSAGVLSVLGRAQVQRILPLTDYIEQHADLFPLTPRKAWETPFGPYRATHPAIAALAPTCTDEVVECEKSTPLRFDLTMPPDLLERLRYRSLRRERDLSKHLRDGRLVNSIAVQGIYRLTEPSAQELEALVCGTGVSLQS